MNAPRPGSPAAPAPADAPAGRMVAVTTNALLFLGLGALFGYLLSRAGATDPDAYAGLFLFRDPQLLWVIGAAVAVSLPGMLWFERRRPRSLLDGRALELTPKPMKRGLLVGSVLFGAGWGLAGACPGTALAMVGQGRLSAGVTVLGIVAGTWLYGALQGRSRPADPPDSRDSTRSTDRPA